MNKNIKEEIEIIESANANVDVTQASVSVQRNPWQVVTIVLATTLMFTLIFGVLWATNVIQIGNMSSAMNMTNTIGSEIEKDTTELPSIMPISIDLPIEWGNIGIQLLATGVIDEQKFTRLYESRGGMSDMMEKMLYDKNVQNIVMTEESAQDLLNLFWAFGLANTNPILSEGPIMDKQYGGDPSRFAATGGWTLRTGDIMDHYNKHSFISLTDEQQARVEVVSKGIFRPCCNNATYFPDCNHGMAMLGLLELLAANNLNEADMYDIALGVNTYWFPSTYETISTFLTEKGTSFDVVAPKDVLGAGLSSASGFQAVKAALAGPAAQQQGGGGGCGV